MTTLNPYIGFNGDARAAMEHYRDVLGGELELRTFAEFGQTAPEVANLIMHSVLTTPGGLTLMGADQPDRYQPGGSISVILSGTDEAELRRYWEGLSAGATILVPFERQMWGDTFGMCVDQFGVSWQVNIGAA